MTRWLIIGGGAAGCVVASRLSEDPSNDVTLLEAGPDHGPDHAVADVGLFLDDPARWHDDSPVVRRVGGTAEHYWQGRGLGGSSLLNGPVMVPNPADADIEHLFPIEPPTSIGAVGKAVMAAVPNAQPVLLSRRDGQRVSAADAYLHPVLDRPNLTVICDSPAAGLVLDGRTAKGAITEAAVEHLADRVVICAGAIRTPALLLASGIDTPGVGEGLQDHPAFAITLELAPEAIDPTVPNVVLTVDRPDTQLLVMNHLPRAPQYGSLIGALMAPTSVGRVTIDPWTGSPLVELNELTTEADIERLTELAVDALDLATHPKIRAVAPRAFVDDQGTSAESLVGNRQAVRAWLLAHLTGYHHVGGSCRRGVVTDEWGAVNGYSGLLVGDASLFDGVPRINPYLSVVTLAERLAARWRDSPPA
jgi:choline dehydrogenase-like flavoprotein